MAVLTLSGDGSITAEIRRTPYDVRGAREAIESAGLPLRFAELLESGGR